MIISSIKFKDEYIPLILAYIPRISGISITVHKCMITKKSDCMTTSSSGNILHVTGTGEFPSQRPVTRSFDVFFDLRLNKRLSKQSWGWWFETPSPSLWRHCNVDWSSLLKWWKMASVNFDSLFARLLIKIDIGCKLQSIRPWNRKVLFPRKWCYFWFDSCA